MYVLNWTFDQKQQLSHIDQHHQLSAAAAVDTQQQLLPANSDNQTAGTVINIRPHGIASETTVERSVRGFSFFQFEKN